MFDRENPGFDAFVGNPPFLGGKRISTVLGNAYRDWLVELHEGANSNADIVAHFFRRAFSLIRFGGAFGLVATNTIAQGDTRSSGLRWICENGGEIFRATKRVKWPGDAAVVVSVLHVGRGASDDRVLDGADVPEITAFLFHRGSHADPMRLRSNADRCFNGSFVLGIGFTFDNTDKKGIATPITEMHRLIGENPRNGECIFPYIGGEEVNTAPTHSHHRYVINFRNYPLRRTNVEGHWKGADESQRRDWLRDGIVPFDYPAPVAADYPELLAIVEEKVKPARLKLRGTPDGRRLKATWWQFGRNRPELQTAITGLERVLACAIVSNKICFTFLPTRMIFSHKLAVFPFQSSSAFCILQSNVHEIWGRFFSSTMKDDINYSPSDCFETFPFPEGWETHPTLEVTGKAYYEHRAALMVRNDEGMTKTYNRFHDPYENDPDISQLRELHATMDRAVLDAYGWTDIPTDCDFLLDYEIDEATWGRKKKPYRYRWPDPVRDDVLARLLALNAKRAAQEGRAGASATDAVQAEPVAARPVAVRDDPAVPAQQRFSWTMRDGC
ncbi:MAG: hypothetical protein OXQ89_16355 [Rhodospirillaceae bacterium]|nr:hypothetical protein [Rhodospirillaceae bacterium]